MIKGCTVNHCALLHLLESGGNRTQDQPISALHATDGFRAHGNLTPSVDGGSLQRKCFKVGVLNFALFNMESKGDAGPDKVLSRARPEQLVGAGRRGRRLPRGERLSQRHFRLCCGKTAARRRIDTHTLGRLFAGPRHPIHQLTEHTKISPNMDSESEHEHRDVNDVESESEQEEVEETKPKSALKKPREAPVQVERPELP